MKENVFSSLPVELLLPILQSQVTESSTSWQDFTSNAIFEHPVSSFSALQEIPNSNSYFNDQVQFNSQIPGVFGLTAQHVREHKFQPQADATQGGVAVPAWKDPKIANKEPVCTKDLNTQDHTLISLLPVHKMSMLCIDLELVVFGNILFCT